MADSNVQIGSEDLGKFAKELAKILNTYQNNDVLAKKTKDHQKNLERLLQSTNRILSDTATSDDFSSFDELIELTELSYVLMKERNEKDKDFQREYTRMFGDINKRQRFSDKVFSRISVSLDELRDSVDLISDNAKKEVTDTALDFLVGPFGKIIKDSVDFGKVKSAFSGGSKVRDVSNQPKDDILSQLQLMKGVENQEDFLRRRQLSGQAHDGMTNVPKEGSYILDGGERVLSEDQNRDLTGFLGKDRLNVFNVGHSTGYFKPIIDAAESRNLDNVSLTKKQHDETMDKFEILGDTITQQNMDFLTAYVMQRRIWFNRWKRHPISVTLGTILEKVGSLALFMAKGFWGIGKFVFGKIFGTKKSDTDKIVESNEDIADLLEEGQKRDRRSVAGKAFDWLKASSGNMAYKGLFGSERHNQKRVREKEDLKSRFNDRSGKRQTDLLTEIRDAANIIAGIQKKQADEQTSEQNKAKLGGLFGFGRRALSSGGKGIARLGKTIALPLLKSLGKSIVSVIKKLGPKLFSKAAGKILGGIGLAFTGGNLIGKYIVNPLIEKIDEVFRTDIGNAIGRAVSWIVVKLSKIPLIGDYIDAGDAERAMFIEEHGMSPEQWNSEKEKKRRVREKAVDERLFENYKEKTPRDVTRQPDFKLKRTYKREDIIDYDKLGKSVEKPLTKLVDKIEQNNNNAPMSKPAIDDYGTYTLIHGN